MAGLDPGVVEDREQAAVVGRERLLEDHAHQGLRLALAHDVAGERGPDGQQPRMPVAPDHIPAPRAGAIR